MKINQESIKISLTSFWKENCKYCKLEYIQNEMVDIPKCQLLQYYIENGVKTPFCPNKINYIPKIF